MKQVRVAVTGGSFILADGWGYLRTGARPLPAPGTAIIPNLREVFEHLPQRCGRFDRYTKLGCAGIALALRDAGIDTGNERHSVGIVTSSVWETATVDRSYYETALVEGGRFASPNLFSYTLPGVMLGECAVHFGLKGPTICVGETGECGRRALQTALYLMADGAVSVMIAGWVDDPPQSDRDVGGAVVVVLESAPPGEPGPVRWIRRGEGRVWSEEGCEIKSLLDLFGT
jgi:3-oxoacyl-[acyl-carrier-protein] synthase II